MVEVCEVSFLFFCLCLFFGPVDAREACFGPCVVAAAYTAVVDTCIVAMRER